MARFKSILFVSFFIVFNLRVSHAVTGVSLFDLEELLGFDSDKIVGMTDDDCETGMERDHPLGRYHTLHACVVSGNLDVVKELLDEEPSKVDMLTGDDLDYALAYAVHSIPIELKIAPRVYTRIVSALLTAGALWDAVALEEDSLNRLALFRSFLDHKSSVDGRAALSRLAAAGKLKGVRNLLKGGASTSVRDAQGRTPLHDAVSNGNLRTARALLKAGADASVVDHQGNRPVCVAMSMTEGGGAFVRLLVAAGADTSMCPKASTGGLLGEENVHIPAKAIPHVEQLHALDATSKTEETRAAAGVDTSTTGSCAVPAYDSAAERIDCHSMAVLDRDSYVWTRFFIMNSPLLIVMCRDMWRLAPALLKWRELDWKSVRAQEFKLAYWIYILANIVSKNNLFIFSVIIVLWPCLKKTIAAGKFIARWMSSRIHRVVGTAVPPTPVSTSSSIPALTASKASSAPEKHNVVKRSKAARKLAAKKRGGGAASLAAKNITSISEDAPTCTVTIPSSPATVAPSTPAVVDTSPPPMSTSAETEVSISETVDDSITAPALAEVPESSEAASSHTSPQEPPTSAFVESLVSTNVDDPSAALYEGSGGPSGERGSLRNSSSIPTDEMSLSSMSLVEKAAALGQIAEVVELMHTLNIDKRGEECAQAMVLAAQEGYGGLVGAMIGCGVPMDSAHCGAYTPLLAAILNNRVEVVNCLLSARAKCSGSALFIAIREASQAVVEAVLDARVDIFHATTADGTTPLIAAIITQNIALVTMFMGRGADIETTDAIGRSPLNRACELGCDDIVRLLLTAGARVDSDDACGTASLMACAREGHLSTVQLMLSGGANACLTNCMGGNALMVACEAAKGGLDVVHELMEVGVDPHAVDKLGRSAVHHTVMKSNNCGPILYCLAEAGVDMLALDCEGRSIIDYAQESGQDRLEALIHLLVAKQKGKRLVAKHRVEASEGAVGSQVAGEEKESRSDSVSTSRSKKRAPKGVAPCYECGVATSKRCCGCKIAYFCSKECQKKKHKPACEDLRGAKEAFKKLPAAPTILSDAEGEDSS